MDRRDFLSRSAAAVAAPTALLLGEREATAVEEDCSWRLPMPGDPVVVTDGKWHNVVETYHDKVRRRWVDGVLVRGEFPVWFTGHTIAELGSWARGETDPDYDKDSEHLAKLINRVRSPDCELDPNLMAGSLQWAKTMAVRGWQSGGRRRRRRRSRRGGGSNHDPRPGAAEIVAFSSSSYQHAVGMWTRSRPHNAIMYGRRYRKMGAGVAKSKGGAWFMCARFT